MRSIKEKYRGPLLACIALGFAAIICFGLWMTT